MKKFLVVFALALVFAAPAFAHAEEVVIDPAPIVDVTPVVDTTPVPVVYVQPGGYSAICAYVLAYQTTCNPADYSTYDFAFNDTYRESILSPWRDVTFHHKYNHQN